MFSMRIKYQIGNASMLHGECTNIPLVMEGITRMHLLCSTLGCGRRGLQIREVSLQCHETSTERVLIFVEQFQRPTSAVLASGPFILASMHRLSMISPKASNSPQSARGARGSKTKSQVSQIICDSIRTRVLSFVLC